MRSRGLCEDNESNWTRWNCCIRIRQGQSALQIAHLALLKTKPRGNISLTTKHTREARATKVRRTRINTVRLPAGVAWNPIAHASFTRYGTLPQQQAPISRHSVSNLCAGNEPASRNPKKSYKLKEALCSHFLQAAASCDIAERRCAGERCNSLKVGCSSNPPTTRPCSQIGIRERGFRLTSRRSSPQPENQDLQ